MNLNLIICKIINVDYKDFSYLVNERGVRPVKAAIRLGASPEIAQIFAGLKLATTAEEITAVYKNDAVKSCMTGKDVGPFYVANGIGCIYSNNYRCLINLTTKSLCDKGYGYHRDIITSEMRKYFTSDNFISNNEIIKEEYESAEILKVIRTPIYSISYYGWEIKEIKFNFFGEGKVIRQWDLHKNELDIITSSFTKFVNEESNFFLTDSTSKTLELVIPNVGRLLNLSVVLQYGELSFRKDNIPVKMLEAMGGRRFLKAHAKHMHERKVTKETLHFKGTWWESARYWRGEKIVTTFSVTISNEYRNLYKKHVRYYETSHVIKPTGVFIPYFDFTTSYRKDVTNEILNCHLFKDIDEIENHYLNSLGDAYRERMNHPRKNLLRGRNKAA